MGRRTRLDAELVRRSLVSSRRDAQEMIDAGRILVNGAVASKSAHQIAPSDAIVVSGPPRRFVSRGGDKLQAALDAFQISVAGQIALDAGASTGGFTDCLLQNGASFVYAVDVGHGQLHPRIRNDERVRVLEKFNIRRIRPDDLSGKSATGMDDRMDIVAADLSFISLTAVIPALVGVLKPGGHLVLLIKPQFEVGRREVSRGRGVITDSLLHDAACRTVAGACEAAGVAVVGIIPSPVLGQEGNREFLLHGIARERLPQ